MKNHRRHVTPTSSERLISRIADGHAANNPVAELLAAARPGPLTDETDGERRAVVAFRFARTVIDTPVREPDRHRVARAMTIKVAVVATVLAGGGVAVAGGAGVIPSLGLGPRPNTHRSPSASGPVSSSADETASRFPSASPTMSRAPEELVNACLSYERLPSDQRARALKTPEYADLVAAAGGRSHVRAYCATLLGLPAPSASPSASPSPSPSDDGHSPHPSHPASGSHPASKSSAEASGKAVVKAAAKPAKLPKSRSSH